jgi:hypothetical protein
MKSPVPNFRPFSHMKISELESSSAALAAAEEAKRTADDEDNDE